MLSGSESKLSEDAHISDKPRPVLESHMAKASVDGDASLLLRDGSDSSNGVAAGGAGESENGDATDSDVWPAQQANRDFATILTFVEGSLVGNDIGTEHANVSRDHESRDHAEEDRPSNEGGVEYMQRATQKMPTLKEVARNGDKKLDEKQYLAYEIICCTFLLQLLSECADKNAPLGRHLGTTLDRDTQYKYMDLAKQLEARGG